MHRRSQFDMRENPASDGRHGSHEGPRSLSDESCRVDRSPKSLPIDLGESGANADTDIRPHAAPARAATGDEDSSHLLTIQQVATILHVPVSWVYARTRKRSTQQLPGIRLGKYWRFREEDIHRWIESQRGGDCVP